MSLSDSEYSRNRNGKHGSIDNEVNKLLHQKNVKQGDLDMLRNKMGNDDLFDKVQQKVSEKYMHLGYRAKKFAQLIRDKYSNSNYPFHTLLEKALKYKQKYHLNDDEFAEFHRIFEQELIGGKSDEVLKPNTNYKLLLQGYWCS